MGSEATLRNGLDLLEALTEEFTEKGVDVGIHSVAGFDECLNLIANEWLDSFLATYDNFFPRVVLPSGIEFDTHLLTILFCRFKTSCL